MSKSTLRLAALLLLVLLPLLAAASAESAAAVEEEELGALELGLLGFLLSLVGLLVWRFCCCCAKKDS